MALWHFIIPFFYGKNNFVLLKGGAPIKRKVSYLRQTIESIQRLELDSKITIFVCNDLSMHKALSVHPIVEKIDCPPKHLPLETVRTFRSWFNAHGTDDDIVTFNEDDQILHMANSVRDDIEGTRESIIFSPHRWARQFLFFRRKGRPIYYLNGRRGVLDNIDEKATGVTFRVNHKYVAQSNRNAAYAACWCMKGSIYRTIDLTFPAEDIELESASYVVYQSRIPVVKLFLDDQKSLSSFIIDHLSGYDYNRRLIK